MKKPSITRTPHGKKPALRMDRLETVPVYLNGKFVLTGQSSPVVNPATGKVFARMAVVARSQVAQAVEAAHAAFAGWRRITAKSRGDLLRKISDGLERRANQVARTITLENGKALEQSRAEVALAVDHLRWFAEEGRRGYGRLIPQQTDGKRNLVVKTPIGVVGAISPWNFPLMLAVRKIAPALAAGCPVILKPASATPLCAAAFAEICHAAGLPQGVFQLVVGPAAGIAQEFLDNPLVRKITFTGSTEVGRKLIAGAAAGIKPLSLELGGLAPVLVFDDADLDRAVAGTMIAKFRNTGQSCVAANRIYVQRGCYNRFVEAFVQQCASLKVGNGLEPGVQLGAMIDAAAVEKARAYVADAVKRGARILCGGYRLHRPGYFFAPTVLAEVPHDSLCMREEIFAPLAAFAPFDTEAEALALANSSPFGLSAYVFTRDLARTFRLIEEIEAGIIGVNDGLPTTSNAPFGGVKQSGWGRELGAEGLDAFLDTKHASIAL